MNPPNPISQTLDEIVRLGRKHMVEDDDAFSEGLENRAMWLIIEYCLDHQIELPAPHFVPYQDEESEDDADEINSRTIERFYELQGQMNESSEFRESLPGDFVKLVAAFLREFGWADQCSWLGSSEEWGNQNCADL